MHSGSSPEYILLGDTNMETNMNLLAKLMLIDKGEFAKDRTAEMSAKRLSEIIGEPVTLKLRALSGDTFMDITTRIVGKNGKADYGKSYDVNAFLVVEGLIEPNVKDSALQKHFGVETPKELVKLFFPGGELMDVANKITELSGFDKSDKEIEDEVKN